VLLKWDPHGSSGNASETKGRKMKRFRMPSPGVVLGIVAVVLALAGTAVAASNLKLANFEPSSRDRLAGTGVIQYAAQGYNTGTVTSFDEVKTFSVQCELAKKATSGGFKWTGSTPPKQGDFQVLDQYPNGGGYVVRMYIKPAGTAENQALSVYSNCVKSRKQNGAPPT
jgi:hypothetical protein